MSSLVDWFSRHGIKALGALLLIELAFHAYAVTSAKKRDAAAVPAAPVAMTAIPAPATSASTSASGSTP